MNLQIEVGEAVWYESLAVYPLFLVQPKAVEYQLSHEAIQSGSIAVGEVTGSGSVPELLVENKGDVRVLFLEGEELVGAKQNRVLNTSLLVPAKSRIKLPVSCVERGRWAYRSQHFGSSGWHSSHGLRSVLAQSVGRSVRAFGMHVSDQHKVWSEVDRQQMALSAESPTAAMSDTFAARQDRIDEFRNRLRYVEGASGMAIEVGARLLCIDLFDKPSTCRAVWDRLMSGFVLDALESPRKKAPAGPEQVQQFLAVLDQASWITVRPAGEGEEYRATTEAGHHAFRLCLEGSLVHASVLAPSGS